MSITVVIADDQTLVRAGFRMIIGEQDGYEVVGEAVDGLEAVALARRVRPDVILMDVRMPVMDGVEATRIVTGPDGQSGTRVIILTTFDLDQYVFDALHAGASGFLLKDTTPGDLIKAIQVVAAGEAILDPSVTRRLIERFSRRTTLRLPDPSVLKDLSGRETEVLQLIARGLSNAEIAAELFVSETTVKSHVAHVLMKLELRDRMQVVIFAYESGIVTPRRG